MLVIVLILIAVISCTKKRIPLAPSADATITPTFTSTIDIYATQTATALTQAQATQTAVAIAQATNTAIMSAMFTQTAIAFQTMTAIATQGTPTTTYTNTITVTRTATRTATNTATATTTQTPNNCIWCGTNTNYTTDFEDTGYGLYIFNSHPWYASASITFTPIANYSGYSKLLVSFDYGDYDNPADQTVAKLIIEDYYGNKITYNFQCFPGSYTNYGVLPFSNWTLTQNPSNPKTWQEILANVRYVRLIDISYYEAFRIFAITASN